MANILANAAGDFHTGATWIGGVVPGVGDNAYTNTRAITITQDVTCDLISNRADGGATIGGTLVCATDGLTITANLQAGTTTLLTVTANIGLTIVGTTTGGTASNIRAVLWNSPGTLTVTGNPIAGTNGTAAGIANSHASGVINITGDPVASTTVASVAVSNTAGGTINITGNCTGGAFAASVCVNNTSTGTMNITGNCLGGATTTAYGAANTGGGTMNITGNCTGAGTTSSGAHNNAAGTLNIVGTATGGESGASGATNASTGTLTVTRAKGNTWGPAGGASAVGYGVVNSNVAGVVIVTEVEYGSNGMLPTLGVTFFKATGTANKCVTTLASAGGAQNLVNAANVAGLCPAITDVRTGVVYGAATLTGTCAVPAASSVAAGVSVDATTGTAVITIPTINSLVGQIVADALEGV